MTNLDTSKLVPPKSLQPALTLTGAQVLQLANIIGNDPGSEDDQITIQFLPDGLNGPGLYAWMTEYPDEGAEPLFDTEPSAQAKSAAKRSQLDAAWELGPLNLSKIALISADSGFPFVVTGQAPKLEPRAAIAAHQAKALEGVEAVACLVNADVGAMVWPIADINEAGTYCDEGEFPELLYPATTLAALQARIAELEQVVAQSVSDIGQLVEMGAEVARYRRLIEMEVSIVPEEKICYYLRNSSELDELIKNEAIARNAK